MKQVERKIACWISFFLILFSLLVYTTVHAENYQPALWFMDDLKITQVPGGGYSHAGTLNFDVAGVQNKNIKAPFDGTIVKLFPTESAGNTVIIQSSKKVLYANGTVDYMSLAFGHDNDISDLYEGKTIAQGQVFCQNGNYGAGTVAITGIHSHVTVIAGKYTDHPGWVQVSTGKWTFANAITPEDALFLRETTNIVNAQGMKFKTYHPQKTLTINAVGGTVTGAGAYKPGDTVRITAVPDEKHSFVKWSSPISGLFSNPNSNSTSFVMPDGDLSITANFGINTGKLSSEWGDCVARTSKNNAALSATLYVDSSSSMFPNLLPSLFNVQDISLCVCTDRNISNVLINIITNPSTINNKVYFQNFNVTSPTSNIDIPGGKRYLFCISMNDVSQLKSLGGTVLSLSPSTTYYYCWQAKVNNEYIVSDVKSFTTSDAGAKWETPKIDNNGYFSSWVIYNKSNIRIPEVGVFVGTNADTIKAIKPSDSVPSGIEKRTDKNNIDTVYDTSKGGTYVFYKPSGFTKISFTPGVTYYYKFYSIDGDGNVVYSSLAQYTWPGSATTYKLTLNTEKGGSIVGQGGNYAANNIINLLALPQPGYTFSGWTATAGSFSSLSNGETSYTMPNQAVTVTALFSPIDYSLHVTTDYGSVNTSVNGNSYHIGDTITLTANQVEGYRFVRWTSDNGGTFEDSTSNETEFTMPAGNVTIMAEYELGEEYYTLTVSSTEGGTVDTSVNGVYHSGNTISITAEPYSGWYFDHWQSKGVVIQNEQLANTIATILHEKAEITAVFINYDPEWTLNSAEGTNIRRAQYNEQISETITSSESVMEGWTMISSTPGEWENDWHISTTPINKTDDVEVEEYTVPAVYRTVYTYTRWKYYNTSHESWYYTYHGNYGGEKQTKTSNTALSKAGKTTDGVQRYNSTSDPWYNENQSSELVTAAYKEYRYRTRPRTYTYSRTIGSNIWQDRYIEGANVRILYKKNEYKGVLRVPVLATIESEAFAGSGITVVLLAEGIKTIEERAFADCQNLISIMIPSSVNYIDDDAFSGSDLITLFVHRGSYGAEYAESSGIPYQLID